MLNQVLLPKFNYSQKYQRELVLSTIFQFLFYNKYYIPLFLSSYFIQILNDLISNYHDYNKEVWKIIYRSNFFVMNYIERALLLLLLLEIRSKQIPNNLLVFIYIRLAKKYCRKNFHKLIPIFVSNAEKTD